MAKRCPVCSGARTIRLPLMSDLAGSFDAALTMPADTIASSRTYPCPECAPATNIDRIKVIAVAGVGHVPFRMADHPRDLSVYTQHVRQAAARQAHEEIMRAGLFRFSEGTPDRLTGEMAYSATIGVVAPAVVATLQQRMDEHALSVARQLAQIAIGKIMNWGAAYGDTTVLKDRAADSVMETVREFEARSKEATHG